jgi:uncharacterized UPF0160 family protein
MKKIGTHSGSFHADEAFAVFLLRQTKLFKDSPVIRTRDPEILKTLDIVVDVGGEYDAARMRFDHHQREFKETMEIGEKKYETKLSSAGLIYKHFGKEVISNILKESANQENLGEIYKKIYEDFVEGLDGIDNGISQYGDTKPKYM